jgi:hypothetical protein
MAVVQALPWPVFDADETLRERQGRGAPTRSWLRLRADISGAF